MSSTNAEQSGTIDIDDSKGQPAVEVAKDEEVGVAPLEVENHAKDSEEGVGHEEQPTGILGKFQYMLVSGAAKKSDDYNVPEMSLFQLFLKFLWFGCRAFGGTYHTILFFTSVLSWLI